MGTVDWRPIFRLVCWRREGGGGRERGREGGGGRGREGGRERGREGGKHQTDMMEEGRERELGSKREESGSLIHPLQLYRSYASGLPAQIVASLNIGLSGMPYSGSDIGMGRQSADD